MGSEIVRAEEAAIVAAPIITVDNFERLVRDELGKIGESFLRIGYYLSEAKKKELYMPLGYNTLFDMAEDLFGFGESSTYNYIAVWERYHRENDPLLINPMYARFSFRQLVECTRDKWNNVGRVILSTDSVRETKAKVAAWNRLCPLLSRTPTLEEIEDEVERQKMRKEREEVERENSTRVENSAPELNGQLPGQTSLFVEGYAEEPTEEIEATAENSTRVEKTDEDVAEFEAAETVETVEEAEEADEDPFDDLPKETAIYAEKLVEDARAKSNAIEPCEEIPADIQMRVHKRRTISYIEIIAMAKEAEGVERFFDNAIKRLVAMRAYKLLSLKQEEKK